MQQDKLTDFLQDDTAPPPKSGALVAIFIGGTAVLVYSLYHGISAAWGFSGSSVLARLAQSAGMLILEYTLFCVLLAWYRGEIVTATQKTTSIVLFSAGIGLSGLNIVVDSWNHIGYALTPFLTGYMLIGIPLMPLAILALGAVTVETSPLQLNKRRAAEQKAAFFSSRSDAEIRQAEAEAATELAVRNVLLSAKRRAAQHLEGYYNSEDFQAALLTEARRASKSLFAEMGIPVAAEPPSPPKLARPTASAPALMASAPLDAPMPTLQPTPPTDAAGSFPDADGGKTARRGK